MGDKIFSPIITSEGVSQGAIMEDAPLHRKSPYIPIRIRELDQISMLNTWATIFVGLSSMSLAALIGFIWDVVITGPISEASNTGAKTLIVVAVVTLIVFSVCAVMSLITKRSQTFGILIECDGYEEVVNLLEDRRRRIKDHRKARRKSKVSGD